MPDFSWLGEVGVSGLIDIVVVALVIYAVLVRLKRTQRAALVLAGVLIVALVYLLAWQFDMRLTVAILQGFFAVFLIALVVIFQEELRYFFEQIAHWSLRRKPLARAPTPRGDDRVEVLGRACSSRTSS